MIINIKEDRLLIVIEDLIFQQVRFILDKSLSTLVLLVGKTFLNT